jgi:hypothetical protein
MSVENVRNENNSCSEECDEVFISCVEQSQKDCLEDFKECSSTCSR